MYQHRPHKLEHPADLVRFGHVPPVTTATATGPVVMTGAGPGPRRSPDSLTWSHLASHISHTRPVTPVTQQSSQTDDAPPPPPPPLAVAAANDDDDDDDDVAGRRRYVLWPRLDAIEMALRRCITACIRGFADHRLRGRDDPISSCGAVWVCEVRNMHQAADGCIGSGGGGERKK